MAAGFRGVLAVCVAVSWSVCVERDARAYRPFDGTDADVVGFGEFELELGPVQWYSQGPSHYVAAPATVLNLGIAPGWELVGDLQNYVGLDAVPGQPRAHLLDDDIFLKAIVVPGSLQDVGPWPSVALEFGPLLPNVSGVDGFGASCNAIVSKHWEDLTLHVDDWAQLTRGDLHFDLFTGIILEGNVDAAFRPVGELFVEHEWVANVTTWSALAGGIWRAGQGLDFDFGLRVARVADERVSEVRLGFTWTIGVWRPRR
jgi:hypothetical protein